jgi:hypothetical protein
MRHNTLHNKTAAQKLITFCRALEMQIAKLQMALLDIYNEQLRQLSVAMLFWPDGLLERRGRKWLLREANPPSSAFSPVPMRPTTWIGYQEVMAKVVWANAKPTKRQRKPKDYFQPQARQRDDRCAQNMEFHSL